MSDGWLKYLQTMKNSMWSSIAKVMGRMGSWMRSARKGRPSPSSNLYRKCHETPLAVFIDCVVDHNYKSLIKYGKASQDEISSAWECLYMEYVDLCGNSSYRQIFTIIKEVGKLESRLMTVRLCFDVLRYRHSAKCVGILNALGYALKFDPTNKESYARDLETLAKKSKAIVLNLQRMKYEYEQAKARIDTDGEITREKFQENIKALERWQGVPLDIHKISVLDYAILQKQYTREAEDTSDKMREIKEKADHVKKPVRHGR